MTPIYFPFSFMPHRTSGHLSVCFPAVGIYLPVESVKEQILALCNRPGFLETRVPEAGLDAAVEDLYRAALQWKDATLGADMSFVKAWEKDRAPFFDETTISYLRRDILRQGGTSRDGAENFLEARLFLRLALEYDLRETEVRQGVGSLEAREKHLFGALRGEDGDTDDLSDDVLGRSSAGPAGDPGARMTKQRLRAWAMTAARDMASSSIFITDSDAVIDHIEEHFPSMTPVAEIAGIPLPDAVTDPEALKNWQDELAAFLEKLVEGREEETLPAPAACSQGISTGAEAVLSFFTISDAGPRAFFEFFAPQAAQTGGASGKDGIKNIVIGRLHMN